jgi:hypothetical protein
MILVAHRRFGLRAVEYGPIAATAWRASAAKPGVDRRDGSVSHTCLRSRGGETQFLRGSPEHLPNKLE